MQRLAAYEDTGLIPEQIKKMDDLFLEKCYEVNRYKKLAGMDSDSEQGG